MRDGRWEMGDERWEMGDERWEMGNERWEMRDERLRSYTIGTVADINLIFACHLGECLQICFGYLLRD